MADASPEAPVGIRCPRCNCADLRTVNTRRLPGGRVRRYKQCRHCDKRVTTIEMPAGEAARAGGGGDGLRQS